MRTLNLSVLILGIIFFFGSTLSTNTFAQDKKPVDLNATSVEKSRGENPNIKSQAPTSDENPMPEPEKERGSLCMIDFNNNTGYYVEIYVNGYYMGTVAPWGVYAVDAYAGYTTIYCITSGGTYEWSSAGNCDYYFDYNLYL